MTRKAEKAMVIRDTEHQVRHFVDSFLPAEKSAPARAQASQVKIVDLLDSSTRNDSA